MQSLTIYNSQIHSNEIRDTPLVKTSIGLECFEVNKTIWRKLFN